MGWASGDEVFDPVADTLIELGASDELKRAVCSVLIAALQNRGWDTESESLGMYPDDPAIVAAFRDNDVVQTCNAEHDTQPWSCELDLGHDGDHDDDGGHQWRDAEADGGEGHGPNMLGGKCINDKHEGDDGG
jgi:hypothetical protein